MRRCLQAWNAKLPETLAVQVAQKVAPVAARVFQEVLHRVLDSAGFPKTERDGKVRRYIVLHSLRHTFATRWVLRGGDIFKLQKILGHQSIQMTMMYAHLAPEAFAADLDRFGTEAPVGPPALVIELPQAAQ